MRLRGAEALIRQTPGQGPALRVGEDQRVPDELAQAAQGQRLAVVPGGQGDPAGEDGSVLLGEALIAQLPQEAGAELGRGDGAPPPGAGDPALVRGVVVSAGGQILLGEPLEPDQDLRRLVPAGGSGQRLRGGDAADEPEGRQDLRGPLGFALQGGGGGDRAQEQGQGAEQGEKPFFHWEASI